MGIIIGEPGLRTDLTRTFDQDGNSTSITDEAGNVFSYSFDASNRKKTCSITRATGFIGTTSQTWTYDGLSRRTQSSDNNDPSESTDDVTCQYFFDSLSRLVEETQKIGSGTARAVSFNYDTATANSVLVESAYFYPDGRRIENTYDRLDRLETRRDNGQSSDIG